MSWSVFQAQAHLQYGAVSSKHTHASQRPIGYGKSWAHGLIPTFGLECILRPILTNARLPESAPPPATATTGTQASWHYLVPPSPDRAHTKIPRSLVKEQQPPLQTHT
jgi:hypothetical protein